MDDRLFDQLSRRVGEVKLPSLPRRGLVALLGSAGLAGVLGTLADPDDAFGKKNKSKNQGASAEKKKKKCKKEGKGCDKKKCKKQDKKCCCNNLKCKNDVCEGEGGNCPTDASFDREWDDFDSDGPDTFNLPWGITTGPDGNVYVTDTDNERVLVFNENGTNLVDEFGTAGEGSNNFIAPRGIGFNENNNGDDRLIVADPDQNDNDDRIRRFVGDPDLGNFGNLLSAIGDETPDNNINPHGVAIDPDDRIWVVNRSSPGLVYLFNRDGGFIADFEPDGQGLLNDPQGIAVFEDEDNDVFVYVADTDNNRVVKFEYLNNDNDGLDFVAETDDNGDDELDAPIGLAVDECGNVWVADSGNNRIAVFDKNLEFIDDFTQGFNLPTGVALGPDGDTIYVVDSINERIVKFDLS